MQSRVEIKPGQGMSVPGSVDGRKDWLGALTRVGLERNVWSSKEGFLPEARESSLE